MRFDRSLQITSVWHIWTSGDSKLLGHEAGATPHLQPSFLKTLRRQLASWTGNSWKDSLNGSVQMEGKCKLGFLIKKENRSQWRHTCREARAALTGKGMRQAQVSASGGKRMKAGRHGRWAKPVLPSWISNDAGQCPGEAKCCRHPLPPDVWVGIPAPPLRCQMILGKVINGQIELFPFLIKGSWWWYPLHSGY